MQQLDNIISEFAFLKPHKIDQLSFRAYYQQTEQFSLPIESNSSCYDTFIARYKTVNLQQHEFTRNFIIEAENAILKQLHQIFYNHATIVDIRQIGLSNIDTVNDASFKLHKLFKKHLQQRYYPTFVIVSSTMYHYFLDLLFFTNTVYQSRSRNRLTLEGILYGSTNVYVDWFAKKDFILFGNNRYDILKMCYNNSMNRFAFSIDTFCDNPENFLTAFLIANPRDPMEKDMTNKNSKQFFDL